MRVFPRGMAYSLSWWAGCWDYLQPSTSNRVNDMTDGKESSHKPITVGVSPWGFGFRGGGVVVWCRSVRVVGGYRVARRVCCCVCVCGGPLSLECEGSRVVGRLTGPTAFTP